jgi:hypothetical protein
MAGLLGGDRSKCHSGADLLEEFMRFGPFLGIAILLLILWAGGFLMFHVASALIHLLLLLAVIALVIHLFSGSKTA